MQHSQSSPNHCCSNHSTIKSELSTLSSATSTLTTPSTKSQETHNNNNNNNIDKNKSPTATQCAVDKNLDMILRNNNGDNYDYKMKRNTMCNCQCRPKDFEKSTLSPDELLREKVKIISNQDDSSTRRNYVDSNRHIERMQALRRRWFNNDNNNSIIESNSMKAPECGCNFETRNENSTTSMNGVNQNEEKNSNQMDVDDWSLMLIGLAQINPTASLVHIDPFDIVPTISIVPPTPESAAGTKYR